MLKGQRVDNEIMKDLGITSTGEDGGGGLLPAAGGQSSQGVLKIFEDHLAPLSGRQLGALLYLYHRGGKWAELADKFMELRKKRGGTEVFLQALETMRTRQEVRK